VAEVNAEVAGDRQYFFELFSYVECLILGGLIHLVNARYVEISSAFWMGIDALLHIIMQDMRNSIALTLDGDDQICARRRTSAVFQGPSAPGIHSAAATVFHFRAVHFRHVCAGSRPAPGSVQRLTAFSFRSAELYHSALDDQAIFTIVAVGMHVA